MGVSDTAAQREIKLAIVKKTKKCPLCPMHDRENRRRRPRSDHHKDRRR